MGSSKSKSSFCPIRGSWVASTPEELVRQNLIHQMIGPLGYPRGLISIELEVKETSRRVDLLCYYKAGEEMRPLLLIECKAHSLNRDAENQLFGYNATVGAPFICLVSSVETKMLWREKGKTQSIPYLPSYIQLKDKVL